MSTTTASPLNGTIFRIQSIGRVASSLPGAGVIHPPAHVALDAPLVGGGDAGVAGGVGEDVDVATAIGVGVDPAGVFTKVPPVVDALSHAARSRTSGNHRSERRIDASLPTPGFAASSGRDRAMAARSHPYTDPNVLRAREHRDDGHPLPLPRRDFLQRSAWAIAGATLFSCTGGSVTTTVDDPTPRIDTATPIKRVIYLMLENRSFNVMFGKFPGVRGTTTGVENGVEKPLIRCPDWLPGDLPHDRAAALNCLAGGKMDGFGTGDYGSVYAYAVFDEDQIPNYWTWARAYALSENFFASANGPSYPNHFFFIAGTSGGTIDNAENIGTITLEDGTKFKSWGCDAEGNDVFVFVRDDDGNTTKHDTCFQFPTVGEQLTQHGIDWAFYSATPKQVGYFWNAYNGIANVFHTDLWQEHVRPIDRIVDDIEAGTLPAVTWATPQFQLSDHPPFSTGHTHNWVSTIVNAVMKSDLWEHTAIFLTWDEWGGFYDPIEPPHLDPVGLGFRVPLLTISPYVRPGVIDTEQGEFSTPLRFISDNWGLPYLSDRIARTHGMDHVFDFRGGPRAPVFGDKQAPAYGESPFQWVGDTYPGWQPGTDPVDKPL
jgi:phospholipase C